MNKQEFLTQLQKGLSGLPQEGIKERLIFYTEMIDDRMEEGFSEEDAVSQVGSVDEIVSQIMGDISLAKSKKRTDYGKQYFSVKKHISIMIPIIFSVLLLVVGGYFLMTYTIIPAQQYNAAEELLYNGDYKAAESAFAELGDYRDASNRILECRDAQAIFYADNDKYNDLSAHIQKYGLSLPVQEYVSDAALEAISQGDYTAACSLIPILSSAPDSQDAVKEALYQKGLVHYNNGEVDTSNELFAYLGTYKDSNQKIHKHNYTVKTENAPTCEKDGGTEYVCSCGLTYTKVRKATGHNYSPATCTKPATCLVCEKTNGSVKDHSYASATCTKAKTCSLCGHTDGSALGHSLMDCVCTRCGEVDITLEQLQGTWQATFIDGTTERVEISGSIGTVYRDDPVTGETVYSGTVQLTDYGFYIEGTYQDYDINGNLYTATAITRCYISKFTSTYFVDTFDDFGPYTWYKQ